MTLMTAGRDRNCDFLGHIFKSFTQPATKQELIPIKPSKIDANALDLCLRKAFVLSLFSIVPKS